MKLVPLTALVVLLPLLLGSTAASGTRVMVIKDSFPKSSQRFYDGLVSAAAAAGFDVEETSASALPSRLADIQGPGSILLLPNARYFPASAKQELDTFLKRGNHLLAVSGPAFSNLVVDADGELLTRPFTKVRLTHKQGTPIIDFAKTDVTTWERSSGSPANPTDYGVEPSVDPEVPQSLHVNISRLDNWDTLRSPALADPFPAKATATVFWAKGGPDTPELVVEWREKDGSRWMATVVLTTEWVRYALTPEDFHYWPDNQSKGRGGEGDSFNPANADTVCVGLAHGISKQEKGAHEYWVSDIRAVVDEYAKVDFTAPILESLSPPYKTHRTFAAFAQVPLTGQAFPAQTTVTSPIPRSPGFGSDGPRARRFIPVVHALDEKSEIRGTAAHLFLNAGRDYAGSLWGYVGFDQDFLEHAHAQVVPLVMQMIQAMSRGVFLANAGADHAAYEHGETTNFGAYLVNLSAKEAQVTLTINVGAADKRVKVESIGVAVPTRTFSEPLFVDLGSLELGPHQFDAAVTLSIAGQKIDQIVHPFRVVKPDNPTDSGPDTVTVRDGDFYLNGKKWYPVGINYWPRYATGLEPFDYWLHWLAPEQYNPEIVEQDLALAEELNINLLSIQYNKPDQARPMMDFLARAHAHGIKVHAYIPGLHPLDQNFEEANKLITKAHLAQQSAFFAYDVGWEVHIGRYDRRKKFHSFWQDWVIDRYGSIQAAEKDWRYTPHRVDGIITGPTDRQLSEDGDWRVYVAAYRRFWDDEISRRYKAVRQNIKTLDNRHLIGARSGYGGTGFLWGVPNFPFDLASGAKHLDFTSPEGYGLGGDRLGFLIGGFNTAYGRFVSGGKPVYWAEYGMSIWPGSDAAVKEKQREYFEHFLSMTRASHANGSAGWWWPGGFRVGENSDYGIVNPDGTPRPAALELQKFAREFCVPHSTPEPNTYLTIDRDNYVTGYPGVFTARHQEYVDLLEAGKTPRLKTEGTGTTSVDTPMLAVGNVPYNGSNPPKYLNAEFNWLKVNGQAVEDDAVTTVKKGQPVYAEASIGNTAEAMWVMPGNASTGAVYLAATSDDSRLLAGIQNDTPYLGDATVARFTLSEGIQDEITWTFRMTAKDRMDFGEVRRVALRPE